MKKGKPKIHILHGWAYSTDKWQPFLKLLEKDFEIVFYKIPGLTEVLHEVWNLNDYVEWLNQLLNKEENLILLGHSNGGRIALAYTLKYPHKISNLILLDSAGITDKRLKTRIKRYLFGSVAKLGKKMLPLSGLRWLMYKLTREQDYYQASPSLRKTMKNLISIDLESSLTQIETQTLLIWGEFDKATPLADGQKMHQQISKSKLKVIEGARHSPMFTHPEETYKLIRKELLN